MLLRAKCLDVTTLLFIIRFLSFFKKYSGAGDKFLKSEMAQLEEKNKVS